MTPDEESVIAALDHAPQTIQALAASCYLPRRVIEKAIQHARLNGEPIVSDERGVWLTDDPAELRAFEERQRSRALEVLRTYSAVKRTRQRLEAPRVLFPELAS